MTKFSRKFDNLFVFPNRFKILVIPSKKFSIFRVNYILKNLTLFFLFHRVLFDILEIKKKIGGHQTSYLSGGLNLTTPHIFRG